MEYKHFSHQHPLTLYKVEQQGGGGGHHQFRCHGCNLPCNDSIFACWICNFFLHEHCGNANRYVKHPSHPPHPLSLMAVPTYCSGSFMCNGCGAPGSTFSYSCPLCEVDLHVPCAYLPLKVSHKSHQHEIFLSFGRKELSASPEYCKVCVKELSFKYWYYFCEKPECDFRVHTFCATSEVKLGQYVDDGQEQGACDSSSSSPAEDVLAEMFKIQLQMQMAQQLNQMFKTN